MEMALEVELPHNTYTTNVQNVQNITQQQITQQNITQQQITQQQVIQQTTIQQIIPAPRYNPSPWTKGRDGERGAPARQV